MKEATTTLTRAVSLAIVVPESSVVLMAFLILDIEHLFLMLVLYLCLCSIHEALCNAEGGAELRHSDTPDGNNIHPISATSFQGIGEDGCMTFMTYS